MAIKIVWSKRASLKFDQIVLYLSEEWGEKSAVRFVKSVFDFLEILSEYPKIGSVENKVKNIRGFTIVKHVNVYYRIKGDSIMLILFFDNRQNPKKKKF
jgi:plasmid stabilization system protein ParE